jgi:hypothetical protein
MTDARVLRGSTVPRPGWGELDVARKLDRWSFRSVSLSVFHPAFMPDWSPRLRRKAQAAGRINLPVDSQTGYEHSSSNDMEAARGLAAMMVLSMLHCLGASAQRLVHAAPRVVALGAVDARATACPARGAPLSARRRPARALGRSPGNQARVRRDRPPCRGMGIPSSAAGLYAVTMADMRGVPGTRYRRPYAVADSLDLLHGPVSGTVHLPVHLDWSGHAEYDLDAPGRIVDLYRAVLNEAASPQDLYTYLDAGMLRRLWAMLWLPVQLRGAWEQRFPVLAEISRVTAA